MTRLNAIIIFVLVFAFLGLCVAFGSTFMAKVLIATVIGGVVVAALGVTVWNVIKKK